MPRSLITGGAGFLGSHLAERLLAEGHEVMAYHRVHGVPTRIARIFNTYGPRMRPHDGRVVSNFLMQALAGQPLTIYGDGQQTRSFCYVNVFVALSPKRP